MAAVDTVLPRQLVQCPWHAAGPRTVRRGAKQHLHRDDLPGDYLAVLHPSVAKGDVDPVGDEVRRRVAQEQVELDVRVTYLEVPQERGDHPASEAHGGSDAQASARRTFAQVAQVLDGSRDVRDAGVAARMEDFAFRGQG